MTTWRKAIVAEMNQHNESWDDIISSTFKDHEDDVEFSDGYGGVNGCEFTVWTNNRVYWPATYDGAEWCASVSRNPDGLATNHIGGG